MDYSCCDWCCEDDVAVLVAVTGVVEDVAMEVEVDIEAVVRERMSYNTHLVGAHPLQLPVVHLQQFTDAMRRVR